METENQGTPTGWGDLFKPPTYSDRVKSSLHHTIERERGISEKAFALQDELMAELNEMWANTPDLDAAIKRFEDQGRRPEFCAECLYAKHYQDTGVGPMSGKTEIARALLAVAKELVAAPGYTHTFANLGGGVSDIYVGDRSFGRDGTQVRVGCFSSSEGGQFFNDEMAWDWKDHDAHEKLRDDIARKIAGVAAKFDKEVAGIMRSHGFKPGK